MKKKIEVFLHFTVIKTPNRDNNVFQPFQPSSLPYTGYSFVLELRCNMTAQKAVLFTNSILIFDRIITKGEADELRRTINK